MNPSPLPSPQASPHAPRSICVLGGGTAGYFAALAIKRAMPHLDVTVVESSRVPIIGVGEATTTLMPPFLHKQLGLSIHALARAVRPTFKLGIRFEWGHPSGSHFTFPFGEADPLVAFALDGHLGRQSLTTMLMDADLGPVLRGPEGQVLSLLPQLKFAYHLDNAPFVRFLAEQARERGIGYLDFEVQTTTRRGEDIDELVAADGHRLRFDFYVDASGFRSELLGRTLGVPFLSYASSLLCDRAVVTTVPQHEGVIQPYTTAETMDAGWCWRIPTRGEDHRGYVYSSAFLDDARAAEELHQKNPGARGASYVRFRSGRHQTWWKGNVVAIGNAYGFVEPLESTALHMVIIEIAYLLAGLGKVGEPEEKRFKETANHAIGEHWDYLRWFLAVHYKYNQRFDTTFWRAARAEVDVTGVMPYLAHFREEGPSAETAQSFPVGDPGFGVNGMLTLLFGQNAQTKGPRGVTTTLAEWEERVSKNRRVASHALSHAEALEMLDRDPALYAQFTEHPASWCERERVHVRGEKVHGPMGAMPRRG